MSKQLFIIGNGFDLHHGIPSNYRQFGEYLASVDPECARTLEEYLFVDADFWYRFEERLATFDCDSVIDHAEQFLVPYSAEDWSDAYHHDFEYEIEQIVDGISRTMRRHFADWIRSLRIPPPGAAQAVQFVPAKGTFISFNYTHTLQELYGVVDSDVLHIHGSASEPDDQIVLDHGWEPSEEEKLSGSVNEETDTRVAGGYRLIDKYFADTFKPTQAIIERSRPFLERLAGVDSVFVLGHSMAEVDLPYFEEFARCVTPTAHWTVSYHQVPDDQAEAVRAPGLAPGRLTLAPLASL